VTIGRANSSLKKQRRDLLHRNLLTPKGVTFDDEKGGNHDRNGNEIKKGKKRCNRMGEEAHAFFKWNFLKLFLCFGCRYLRRYICNLKFFELTIDRIVGPISLGKLFLH